MPLGMANYAIFVIHFSAMVSCVNKADICVVFKETLQNNILQNVFVRFF